MNIRAAEAMVSRAPKPMKIFPISEVWSQAVLSLLLAATGAAGAAGASAEANARGAAGAVLWRSARSTSLSWSAATTWPSDRASAAGGASAGLSGEACRISLARAAIALAALPVDVSADVIGAGVSWALALATDGGIADGWSASSAASAVLLPAAAFSATLLDRRGAYFFQWCACLANLWRATGAPAVSDGAVPAAPSAPCDGPAKHTKSPAASSRA